MHRMVYPFLSTFAAGFGVGLPAISLALTVRALSGFAGPLVAPIADTRGRKIGLLLGLGLYTIGVGLMVIWPVFPVFVLTLILTNIGNLTFIPSMQAYLGDRVPYSQRGLAMAVTEMGWSLSFIINRAFGGSFN